MKSLSDANAGKPVPGPVSYLTALHGGGSTASDFSLFAPAPVTYIDQFFNLEYLEKLFQYNALLAVTAAGQDLEKNTKKYGKFDPAFNACALEMCNAVKAHCYSFILHNFVAEIYKVTDPAIQTVLVQLCTLYACSNISDESVWSGTLPLAQVRLAKAAAVEAMERLRSNAIALVDAFDIPDRILNSTIGRSDGNVYEALYEHAKRNPLNAKIPFEGYEYLRPHLDLENLKTPNRANL